MTYLKDAAKGSEQRNSSGILQLDFWIPVYIISFVTHLIESHSENVKPLRPNENCHYRI